MGAARRRPAPPGAAPDCIAPTPAPVDSGAGGAPESAPRRSPHAPGAAVWYENPSSRGTVRTLPQTWLCAVAIALVGCSSVGEYVWVDSIRDPGPAETEYVIASGDILNIRVFGQEGVSGRARVRTDGMISLPFVNDVEAAGQTPPALARRLQQRLKEFINNPVVTVSLEEPGPMQVSVLGEVTRAGVYPLQPGANVLQALAAAGGLAPYASKDRIFVLRKGPPGTKPPLLRIRFTYEKLAHAEGRAGGFRVRDGDVVVVE